MRIAGKGFSLLPQGFTLLGSVGVLVWGSALLFVGLCAGKYIAPLIEYERGGPQHPAHGGVTFPGILLASARGHEWLVTCVPVQDVLSQGKQ